MAVAKPRKRKTIGAWLKSKIFPPSSKTPGQMDFPAITEVKKAAARRRKMIKEMEF